MCKKIIIGIALGDQAGIASEVVAKALLKMAPLTFIPVLVGNEKLFRENCCAELPLRKLSDDFKREDLYDGIWLYDIEAGPDIETGRISGDSGCLMYDSLVKTLELEKAGLVDAVIMAPITKQALHEAGLMYTAEFDIFKEAYNVKACRAVVTCEHIFRSTVVGHVAFRDIPEKLTEEGIISTAEGLYEVVKKFNPGKDCTLAVAALNPHAGENGLFGDEEERVISPAIRALSARGIRASGPWPADTVFLRALQGKDDGVVFMYHDQGNIAMKSRFFGEGVLIYTGIPAIITSVGHGSALDIAGKGIADEANMVSAVMYALELAEKRKEKTK